MLFPLKWNWDIKKSWIQPTHLFRSEMKLRNWTNWIQTILFSLLVSSHCGVWLSSSALSLHYSNKGGPRGGRGGKEGYLIFILSVSVSALCQQGGLMGSMGGKEVYSYSAHVWNKMFEPQRMLFHKYSAVHADRYLGVAADKGVGVGYSKPMKQASKHIKGHSI